MSKTHINIWPNHSAFTLLKEVYKTAEALEIEAAALRKAHKGGAKKAHEAAAGLTHGDGWTLSLDPKRGRVLVLTIDRPLTAEEKGWLAEAKALGRVAKERLQDRQRHGLYGLEARFRLRQAA